jgi:hypothetical protein
VTATLPRGYRSWTGPRAATPLPSADELIAKLPPSWRPTPPERRDVMWAFCSRCSRPALLRIGPGDALCDPCARAESWDRAARPGVVGRG